MRRAALVVMLALVLQPGCARAQEDPREALRTGRYDAAIAALERSAETGDAEAMTALVRALIEVGRYEEAERAVRAWDGAMPSRLGAAYGEALLAQGKVREAERAFLLALHDRSPFTAAEELPPLPARSSPGTERALLQAGLLAWRNGERAQAHDYFDQFIDIYNSGQARTSEALAAVGVAVSHLGRRDPDLFHDANRALAEAIELDPANHEARVLRGLLFLEKYNTTDAGALFREVLEQNPRHPGALLGMARVRMVEGSGDPAELFDRALETNPRSVDAHLLRARMQMVAERYDSADASLARALAIDSSSLDAHVLTAASAYLRGDDWNRAAQEVLERSPQHSAVYTTMGDLAVQTRRYRDAVRMADRAIAVDSTDWSAHALRGLNLMRSGDVASARGSLEASFAGDPFNVWVKNTLDLLDTYPQYVDHASQRFTFFLHRDEADLLFPYAAAIAEEAYDALSERYGHDPETPVRVEIYPRHDDFSVRTVGLAGLGALGVSFGNILAMDSPAAREPGSFHWGSTLWHEVAHTFTLGEAGSFETQALVLRTAGPHSVTVTDDGGYSTTSGLQFTYSASRTLDVVITSPTPRADIALGGELTVSGTATGNIASLTAQLYQGLEVLVGRIELADDNSFTAVFSTEGLFVGDATVAIDATDELGVMEGDTVHILFVQIE